MKFIINIFLVHLLSVSSFAQTINNSKSVVNFEIGNLGFNTVEGTFKKMTGEIKFDPADLSSASLDVCVDASTVDTKSKKRDDHLKNEDFFHIEKYANICFKSESVVKKGDEYVAKGKLTMHGVTKQVEILFTYSAKTFTGSLTVNRYDYKIGAQTSKFMVSEEAVIEIICAIN